jgi:NDP-sugar pyrophosphorylase family protein
MNIVIPMAGLGSRFTEAGYTVPKPLLRAHGKTLLEWSVDSLPLDIATRLVFVGLEEHRDCFGIEDVIRSLYHTFDPVFHWLTKTTRGQAETVVAATPLLDQSAALLIFNIDTAFRSPGLGDRLRKSNDDGVLGAFHSSEPRFSYARTGPDGYVTEVREKVAISDNALTGLYHFKSTKDFLEVANATIAADVRECGEFYVAPLYNQLIARGGRFVVDQSEHHWILGTPAEYARFLDDPDAVPPVEPR